MESFFKTACLCCQKCNFDNQDMRWAVDIRENTIEEAWKSREFENFRNLLKSTCPNCAVCNSCMGGCPVRSETVLCDREDNIWVM